MPTTPAKPDSKAEPDPPPAPARTTDTGPAADEPGADAVPAGRLPAGVYEFTGPIATQYLDVPLTARPAESGSAVTKTAPAVPATAATVFDWPFGAPADGRWAPTKKKSNQVADNAAPLTSEE